MLDKVLNRVTKQYDLVKELYPKHPSLQHSAWVVNEEYEEFLKEMREKDYNFKLDRISSELIDIVVACLRMIEDNEDLYQACVTNNIGDKNEKV